LGENQRRLGQLSKTFQALAPKKAAGFSPAVFFVFRIIPLNHAPGGADAESMPADATIMLNELQSI
jgi:hypothetical protein